MGGGQEGVLTMTSRNLTRPFAASDEHVRVQHGNKTQEQQQQHAISHDRPVGRFGKTPGRAGRQQRCV